jgi:hypothetical protein
MRVVYSGLIFLLLAGMALADVDFDYVWIAPDAEAVTFNGKKVAVILVSKNRAPRSAAEEALAKELTKRGAEGIAGHTLVTESELKDPELAKTRFKEQEVAGVLIIRGTPKGGEPVDPNMWKDPMYKDIWGFTSKSWQQEVSSTDPDDVEFRVEISLHALEQNRLIWIGTTDMEATELSEFIHGVVDEVADELSKARLLLPRE